MSTIRVAPKADCNTADLLFMAVDNLWRDYVENDAFDNETWATLDVLHMRAAQLRALVNRQIKPMSDFDRMLHVSQILGMLQDELLEN